MVDRRRRGRRRTTRTSGDRRRATRYAVRSSSSTFRLLCLGTALGAALLTIPAGPAAGHTTSIDSRSAGVALARDISFPQCGGSLPDEGSAVLGVIGANGGIAFTRNPCLVAELAWAKRLAASPAFYANTGNPGPERARFWPIGQTVPKACAPSDP